MYSLYSYERDSYETTQELVSHPWQGSQVFILASRRCALEAARSLTPCYISFGAALICGTSGAKSPLGGSQVLFLIWLPPTFYPYPGFTPSPLETWSSPDSGGNQTRGDWWKLPEATGSSTSHSKYPTAIGLAKWLDKAVNCLSWIPLFFVLFFVTFMCFLGHFILGSTLYSPYRVWLWLSL